MFFDNLEILCKKNNLKITQLLKELGLSKSAISRWRNGTLPTGDVLIKLADYFSISVDYLLGRTNISSTSKETIIKESVEKISLIDNINQLNNDGIKKMLDYSNDLISIGKYTEEFVTVVVAARSENNNTPVQKIQIPKSTLDRLKNIEENYDENL